MVIDLDSVDESIIEKELPEQSKKSFKNKKEINNLNIIDVGESAFNPT